MKPYDHFALKFSAREVMVRLFGWGQAAGHKAIQADTGPGSMRAGLDEA